MGIVKLRSKFDVSNTISTIFMFLIRFAPLRVAQLDFDEFEHFKPLCLLSSNKYVLVICLLSEAFRVSWALLSYDQNSMFQTQFRRFSCS